MQNSNKILLVIGLLFYSIVFQAQSSFPKSAKEDKGKIMSEAYWKLWNPSVQEKIDRDIEQNRKGDALVLIDNILAGTTVKVEQVSHDFYFGANIFNFNQLGTPERNRKYRELFGTLFNSATVGFYWREFEMMQNCLRFKEDFWDTEDFWNHQTDPSTLPHWRRPSTDQVIEYCISRGVRVHGHCLVWSSPYGHPKWLFCNMMPEEKIKMDQLISKYADPFEINKSEKYSEAYKNMSTQQLNSEFPHFALTLKRLFEKRIVEIANYYGDKVNSWDIVNESSVDFERGLMVPNSGLCKSCNGISETDKIGNGIMPGDYTYEAFKVAGKSFSKNVMLNINDYNTRQSYPNQVKNLLSRGLRVDIIGSQMHLMNPQQSFDIAAGEAIQIPDSIWAVMERLSNVGLPIHLSEITIPAPGDTEHGRLIQATIAHNMYRLWFSIKSMMGITWWNVVDGCGYKGEPSVSGLFTRDMDSKPSFYALNSLINGEWKTNLTVKADKNGNIKFRGFKGKYLISWTDKSGNKQITEYHLK